VLVLASSSRYRRRLLAEAGISAVRVAPDVDERLHDAELESLGPCGLALRIAEAKARAVVVDAPGPQVWVLAADQLAVLDEPGPDGSRLLTKPGTPGRAVEQLLAMSGGTHRLVNGIVVLHEGEVVSACDVHVVAMERFDRARAAEYVDRFRPLDCVGAYRIEDDAGLIRSVEGSGDDGVIGLPITVVRTLLTESGWAEDR
jgi:septum formation protein